MIKTIRNSTRLKTCNRKDRFLTIHVSDIVHDTILQFTTFTIFEYFELTIFPHALNIILYNQAYQNFNIIILPFKKIENLKKKPNSRRILFWV